MCMRFHRCNRSETQAERTTDAEHGLVIIAAGIAFAIALVIATHLPEALEIASSHVNAAHAMLVGARLSGPR
jgi:hypothetical protein